MDHQPPSLGDALSGATEPASSPPVRRSLRTHITLLIALLILVPALLTSAVLGIQARRTLRAQTYRHLDALAEAKAQEIAVRLDSWLALVELFSQRPALLKDLPLLSLPPGSPARQAAEAQLTKMLRGLATYGRKPIGDAVIVRLKDHEPLLWYGFSSRDQARAAVRAVRIGADRGYYPPRMTDASMDSSLQRVVLPLVILLRDPPDERGRRLGLLVLRIHVEAALSSTLHDTSTLGPTGEILLLDQRQRLLMQPEFAGASLFEVVPDPTARALATHKQITALEGKDYRGVPVLAAEADVPYTNWALVAEVDAAHALTPLRRLYLFWLSIVMLALAVGLVLADLSGRSLARPVLALSSAVRSFAEGDVTARVHVQRDDELGQLGRDFNMMADRLAGSRQELERQVAARTAELSAANENLHRLNEEMASFTYSVSHDLSSPLVSLQGLTGLLLRDYGDKLDDDAKRRLGRLQANVEMMSALVGDLLDLSRVGRLETAPAPVDLCKLIRQVVDSLQDSLTAGGIAVVRPPEPCLEVFADANRVRQVLSNLVANAIKYRGDTPEPRIEVSYDVLDDQMVRVNVKDNGMGIAAQHHERIFQPFQRLPEAKSQPGTGMGLAIAKKIVQLYGGSIWVESEVGQGATFHFTLPREGEAP